MKIVCVLALFALVAISGVAGQCNTDADCNDNNPCTNDTCNKDYIVPRCEYTYLDIPCNDGNECTCNDRCLNGQCHGDQIVSADCRPPGKYVVETWIFVLLAAISLISVLLLIFMLCLRFIAPPEQQYGSATYAQQW